MSKRNSCHPEHSEGSLTSAAQRSLAVLGMTGCAWSGRVPLSRYFSAYHGATIRTPPHPEERPAGPRLEGWAPDVVLVPILRDAALHAAPQDEVSFLFPYLKALLFVTDLSADPDDQLAEVLAFQQAEERLRRLGEAVDDGFAALELA